MFDIVLDPLVWIAAALAYTALRCLLGDYSRRCFFSSCACLCLLVIVASPAFANRWLATLENAYPLQYCDKLSATRPIVVLAGGLDGGYRNFPLPQRLSNASKNRALAAAAILEPGGLLFVAGGRAPDRSDDAEADAMHQLIAPLLPANAKLVVESDSANTFENAANLDRLFAERNLAKDIVLVTSASHMQRAAGVFLKRGFAVCAYAVDPRQRLDTPLSILWPRVSALQKTDIALHEWIGWLYYRKQGYL